MSLKAIKRIAFENMIDALDAIERIQQCNGEEGAGNWELQDLRDRLQEKHDRYLELLAAIADQIDDFERLYRRVKMGFIPEKLKGLKRVFSEDSKEFILVKETIQKAYRE